MYYKGILIKNHEAAKISSYRKYKKLRMELWKKLVPVSGLEPPTHALRMRCSTN